MARNRRGSPDTKPNVQLTASNCERVVLDAYALAMQYAHDENKALDVAVRAWRQHTRSVQPDDAPHEVASIIRQQEKEWGRSSDRNNKIKQPVLLGKAMALENHHVFFEGPVGRSVGEIMGELRFWLDKNKIVTLGFSYEVTQSGAIEAHLTFGSRYHAALFEQAFCSSAAAVGSVKRTA